MVTVLKEVKPRNVQDFQRQDAASRGVLDSFSVVYKVSKWPLTSLGAALTILAFLIHPFLQTIPINELRLTTVDGLATIPRASDFGYAGSTPDLQGPNPELSTLTSAVKGAVYAGIYNLTSYSTISAICPTGKCTWTSYTSLGVCGACDAQTPQSVLNPAGYDGPDDTWSVNEWTIQASANTMIVTTSQPLQNYGQLHKYNIVNITSMYFPPWQGSGGVDSRAPDAFECALFFCVKTYSAKVVNGKLVEKLQSTFPNGNTSSSDAEAAICPPIGSPGIQVLPSETIYLSQADGNFTINPPHSDEQFHIDNTTFAVMRRWSQETMMTNITASLANSASLSDVSQAFYGAQTTENGPNAMINRIADGLTSYMRNQTGETAAGTTQVIRQYVHARWGWAVLPLIIQVLTLAFLIATIAINAHKRIPTWRSSTLPTLVYGLDDTTASAIAMKGPGLNGLEKEAERHVMSMSTGSDLWRLEGT